MILVANYLFCLQLIPSVTGEEKMKMKKKKKEETTTKHRWQMKAIMVQLIVPKETFCFLYCHVLSLQRNQPTLQTVLFY